MAEAQKILILDDEPAFRELARELLSTLSCAPEVRTASSGAQALSMLEAEKFQILLTDLRMPSMDGLQVLTIVRRRFPALRTIVITGLADEEFRARAYATGIDLYLEKPKNAVEIKLFVDCIESLLDRKQQTGFRGVQSKSLADIVQMESLSGSSVTLKFNHGAQVGKIWMTDGILIDAELDELNGEEAFQKIMAWKSGAFESLPGEPNRPRRIQGSVQGLLLDSAQMVDEAAAGEVPGSGGAPATALSPLVELGRQTGAEFVLTTTTTSRGVAPEHWACENPGPVAAWAAATTESFRTLGEELKAGPLNHIAALGTPRHATLVPRGDRVLCAGFSGALDGDAVQRKLKELTAGWDS